MGRPRASQFCGEHRLVFDNSDGRIGGEFSAYADIAIRREVSRDGQSNYLLNGNRCRRRDIQDIFLGTGFRSAQLLDYRAGHDFPVGRGQTRRA